MVGLDEELDAREPSNPTETVRDRRDTRDGGAQARELRQQIVAVRIGR